ncbi:MAG: hypothetical protein ABJH98_10870 [Reichenbachiella sp.]|uniref:hypothetical protein n=1 Tax=Reichenbachiella sp. TaxID=2184521 RepID=UPI003298A09A
MKIHSLILLLSVLLGLTFQSIAQSDSLKIEKKKKPLMIRGYVAGVYESAPVSTDRTNSFGVQAAVILKKHFQVGFYGLNFSSKEYRRQLIFPNTFQMNYKHAGILVGYRTSLEKNIEFNLVSKYGFGEVKWDQVETGYQFLADKFRMFHLQASADYLVTKLIAVNAFMGYRWMQDLDITGLTNESYTGLYYGLAIKVGVFK